MKGIKCIIKVSTYNLTQGNWFLLDGESLRVSEIGKIDYTACLEFRCLPTYHTYGNIRHTVQNAPAPDYMRARPPV